MAEERKVTEIIDPHTGKRFKHISQFARKSAVQLRVEKHDGKHRDLPWLKVVGGNYLPSDIRFPARVRKQKNA